MIFIEALVKSGGKELMVELSFLTWIITAVKTNWLNDTNEINSRLILLFIRYC